MKIQLGKRRNTNSQRIETFLFLVISIAILIFLEILLSPKPFTMKESFGLNDFTQLLSLLFFISLLLERFLEVFITTWRGSTVKELDVKLSTHKKKILDLESVIEKQLPTVVSSATVQENKVSQETKEYANFKPELIKQLNVKINELYDDKLALAHYKFETKKIALWSSFILGIIISAIGIRGLEMFVNVENLPQYQISVFRVLDMLLTGGLIAGGSEGIHKLTQVLTDFSEATSAQIKDKTQ
ncbi:MAG: hypothetical protein QNJ47_20580 [Nostocaceae cyanobacterium]|nr:hypothetical protein [Nostocaceae cyanobacterium]